MGQTDAARIEPGSTNVVDYYEYRVGKSVERFSPDHVIHFRYPDPRDPYNSGLSPLRACFEKVSLISDYAVFKQAKFQNGALPDAIVSPDEVIGEEERERLEEQWNRKFRKGGAGRILVDETGLKVQLLSQSMGDVAEMAEMGKTKEDVANAFHVPLAFLTTQTNLANLQAAEHQHMTKAIGPRLPRRDEKLNEQLIPIYNPSRRLLLASEDTSPITSNGKRCASTWSSASSRSMRLATRRACRRCRGVTSRGCQVIKCNQRNWVAASHQPGSTAVSLQLRIPSVSSNIPKFSHLAALIWSIPMMSVSLEKMTRHGAELDP